MKRLRDIILVVLVAVGGGAAAQSVTLGLTLDPLSANGVGVGVQVDAVVASTVLSDVPVSLAARADVSVPASLGVAPTVNGGLTVRVDLDEVVPFMGAGFGAWFQTIDGVVCVDATWSLHGGLDVPLGEAWSLRLDVRAAPLVGAYVAGVGVAIPIGE